MRNVIVVLSMHKQLYGAVVLGAVPPSCAACYRCPLGSLSRRQPIGGQASGPLRTLPVLAFQAVGQREEAEAEKTTAAAESD